MAHGGWGQHLLVKPEDLSLIPRNGIKKLAVERQSKGETGELVGAQGLAQGERGTYSCKLSSDLHVHTVAHARP